MKRIYIAFLLLLAFALNCSNSGTSGNSAGVNVSGIKAAYSGSGSDVMLQGFTWSTQSGWWNTVASNASAIAEAGFTMVWLPPCSLSADTYGYLPTQWYNLGSNYGTQAQLQSAISALHTYGLEAIADIVINHRCGSTNWADFSNPAFTNNLSAICSNDEYFESGNPGYGSSTTGAYDTGESYSAGRDLDHTYSSVQTEVQSWLAWLKSTIGYDGWRYDFVKGYSGSYVGTYNDSSSPCFSVGEFWPTNYFDSSNADNWRQQMVDWVSATGSKSAVFDFVTKPLLATAISDGNYALLKDSNSQCGGVIGWWPGMSVTFLDNHDTGPTPYGQGHWSFPSGSEAVGYAYILTHPGTPCVFWPHYFNYGSTLQTAIKTMIAIRKAQGITSTSSVSIQVADSTRYAAIINSNTAVKIGPGDWSPTGTWTLATSGTNYAIWTSGGGSAPAAVTDLAATASGTSVTLSWTASSGATSYTVYRSTDASTYSSIGTATSASYTDSGLSSATTYYYKLTATNSYGTSADSNVASATTGTVTTHRVHFKVNSYANWSTPYCYYWAGDGSTAANSWPGTAMTSEGSSWYYFDIPGTSSNVIFDSGSSSAQTADLSRSGEGWFVPGGTSNSKVTGTWYDTNPDNITVPSAPTGVTVSGATSSTLTVSWTASTDASSYTVYRSTSSSGTYSQVGTTTSVTYTDSGLTASTTYYYKVTATNSAGTSDYSSAASGTTSDTTTVTTTINVVYDVGYGNSMYVRGSVSPLSWTTGLAMTWTTGNVWTYTTTAIPSGTSFEFKALINNSTWSSGSNFTGTGGSTITVTPSF